MAKKRVFGTAEIRIDGAVLLSHPGASLDVGGPKRTTVVGTTVHGFAEAEAQAKLDCEISLKEGVSVTDIRDIDDATVYFKADTGQTWIMRNAWVTDTPVITDGSDGGKVKVTLEATPAEELL